MANKMLIDASHPEETRVVVLRGNRVEEFDFESASKKPLRGNIYLAKVTRVEPSLQAAFVDYGGNRHGFLAFSEIHPDYYQIPIADRQALLEEEARAQRDEEDEDGRLQRRSRRHRSEQPALEKRGEQNDASVSESAAPLDLEADEELAPETDAEAAPFVPDANSGVPDDAPSVSFFEAGSHAEPRTDGDEENGRALNQEALSENEHAFPELLSDDGETGREDRGAIRADEMAGFGGEEITTVGGDEITTLADEEITTLGGDDGDDGRTAERAEDHGAAADPSEDEAAVEQLGGDAMEEMPNRVPRLRRQYKIQEVIKRRQVLLVQVVKEERGNKGAALTTYLSLAGRYSVLMPNTARGGGISRKITNVVDRKRLKSIAQELEVPEGMGVILRTAGASRTKAEVKRDFEYLLRMWETVRELTLKSTAPSLVYEEGSLIKRAIRDLYNKDIDEVIVAGDDGYREAKDFMRMLMPSHAKNVKPFKDAQPIFAKAGAEAQLDAMFSNQVTLKSGGYIVINQTEALVAIDVNSGRSTREHNIEDTALRTNLEAADEVARQLRLRDLAGLIVVDFIDMEESRNNRAVERRIKDALKNDRARIQVGRISHFGLLEMSRQRIRTGVLEGSTIVCPHCAGAGMVRSTASIALHVLRVLEDALIKNAAFDMTVRTRSIVALYILNQKRPNLRELEQRFGVTITVAADDSLAGTTYHSLERGEPVHPTTALRAAELATRDPTPAVEPNAPVDEEETDVDAEAGEELSEHQRRSQQRRDGRGAERMMQQPDLAKSSERLRDKMAVNGERAGEEANDAEVRRRRRRRRRRGRGPEREPSSISPNAPQPSDDALAVIAQLDGDLYADGEHPLDRGAGEDGEPSVRSHAFDAAPPPAETVEWPGYDQTPPPAATASENPPQAADQALSPPADETPAAAQPSAERLPELAVEVDPARPKRTGWWARAKQTLTGE
jgi:ribonuclease E